MKTGIDVLDKLFDKYKIPNSDRIVIFDSIKNILLHDEFQRRLNDPFYHHGTIMLGEHILQDVIVTYLLCKRNGKVNTTYALKIAMMHDLYTRPWQNSGVKKEFFHRHGFIHPIEAAINSSIWFQDEFNDSKKSEIIIDGIVHHMYPLPVTSYNSYDENILQLYNYELSKRVRPDLRDMLIDSSNRARIGEVSLTRSKFKEGRIMSFADKMVSISDIDGTGSITSLITGKNKRLLKNHMI